MDGASEVVEVLEAAEEQGLDLVQGPVEISTTLFVVMMTNVRTIPADPRTAAEMTTMNVRIILDDPRTAAAMMMNVRTILDDHCPVVMMTMTVLTIPVDHCPVVIGTIMTTTMMIEVTEVTEVEVTEVEDAVGLPHAGVGLDPTLDLFRDVIMTMILTKMIMTAVRSQGEGQLLEVDVPVRVPAAAVVCPMTTTTMTVAKSHHEQASLKRLTQSVEWMMI